VKYDVLSSANQSKQGYYADFIGFYWLLAINNIA
jgi:hypothetical protein